MGIGDKKDLLWFETRGNRDTWKQEGCSTSPRPGVLVICAVTHWRWICKEKHRLMFVKPDGPGERLAAGPDGLVKDLWISSSSLSAECD